MEINTSLSSSQARFATWIEEEMPYLWPLFDFSKRELISSSVDEYCEVASRGEQIMARFAAGVWCGNNQFNFDFIEAAAHLYEKQMSVVTDWLKSPFWP